MNTDAEGQIVAIPPNSWPHDGGLDRRLEIATTVIGDDVAEIRVRGRADGILIRLNSTQLDEIAADFQARAALMRGAQ